MNSEYFKEFILGQKCIPWKIHLIVNQITKKFFGEYDNRFFNSKHRNKIKNTCVKPIVSTLIKRYSPKSVIDLGCGDGIYLEEFMKYGIGVLGLDNSVEGIRICRKRGINIKKFNFIKNNFSLNSKFDLLICFEVAEHLPSDFSDKLVKLITELAKIVIFTAAQPGQGGTNHINEQPKLYWINKFLKEGFYINKEDTEELQKQWIDEKVVDYMISNLIVFQKLK